MSKSIGERLRSPVFSWSDSGKKLSLIKDGLEYTGELELMDSIFDGEDEQPMWTINIIDGPNIPLFNFDEWDYKWETNIKHNPPPNKKMVQLLCDDYMGEYLTTAMRQDYKKPVKGQSKKGFKQGWRWIGINGQTLTRKEMPSAWRYL